MNCSSSWAWDCPHGKDGQRIVPVPARQSRPGQATLEEILAAPVDSQTYRNKVVVSAYKSEFPPPGVLPDRPGRPYDVYLRGGFKHFVDYGNANGLSDQGIGQAFPDRQDKVDFVLAEGDTVWIQFRLSSTHGRSLFGIPPTNRPIEAAEVGIMTFDGARWDTGWFFGDDLGNGAPARRSGHFLRHNRLGEKFKPIQPHQRGDRGGQEAIFAGAYLNEAGKNC